MAPGTSWWREQATEADTERAGHHPAPAPRGPCPARLTRVAILVLLHEPGDEALPEAVGILQILPPQAGRTIVFAQEVRGVGQTDSAHRGPEGATALRAHILPDLASLGVSIPDHSHLRTGMEKHRRFG